MVDLSLVRLHPRLRTNYVASGRTVLATGDNGVVGDEPDQGLFVYETRMLSRHRYLIDGAEAHLVSASNVAQRSWLDISSPQPRRARSTPHPHRSRKWRSRRSSFASQGTPVTGCTKTSI